MHGWGWRGLVLTVCAFLASAAAGCGGGTAKTQEAVTMIGEMDYQGALAALAEAQEGKEDAYQVLRVQGIAYMGLASYEEAIECFLGALSLSDGLIKDVDFDVNYYLAEAYSRIGRFAEAKDVYNAILALRDEEEDAYFKRGGVELELDQYTEAKADFDRVVEMDPKNYDRLFAIYEVFAHFGYKEAGQEYLRYVLENGEDTLSSFDRGRLYYYLEDYQKAYVELEKAKEDGTAQSSLYLGKAYEATGDYNYACNVYRSYLDKQGDSAEMYNQLGICELKRQNYREALSAFQSGLALQDKAVQQTLSYNEIVAYEYLGEFEKAESLIQAYAGNYPDDAEAKRERDFLATRHSGAVPQPEEEQPQE